MSSEEGFLRALADDPEDEATRLIYTDWLMERDDPRASFVRIAKGVPRFRALLADVHANLEALEAVLADVAALNVNEIYCLGDLVNYGPNPLECIDRAMTFRLNLLGNFDQAVLFDPVGFIGAIEKTLRWTRRELENASENNVVRERRWAFLADLPRSHKDGDFLFVHGSPRNPLNEWIFPEDIYNESKMNANFALVDRYCFQGHTHVPGLFIEGGHYFSPEEVNNIYHLDQRKTLCNVGSVGQPRDGDWRASYVLLVGDTIFFRRVEYDVETTVRKVYAIPELDNIQGDRLREGR